MDNLVKDVHSAHGMLTDAIAAARAGGYRVKWQTGTDGDVSPIVDGGPEPKAEAPKPAAEDQD